MSRVMRNRLLTILSVFLLLSMITYEMDVNKTIDDLTQKSNSLEAHNKKLENIIDSMSVTNDELNQNMYVLNAQYSDLATKYQLLEAERDALKVDYDKLKAKNDSISRGMETRRTAKSSTILHATGYIANYDKAPYYGTTKSGVKAKDWYTVAVNTSQYPLGTKFYRPALEKYNGTGIYVAEDTGSAVGYGDIDICVPTTEECYSKIGSRKIEVFVLELGTGKVNR